jgi:hypothetical protein
MAQATPDWDALRRQVACDVLLPGSDAYESVRKPFIARFDEIEPQAIVLCTAPEDVAEVVAFARRDDIETATRSGGHCLAGFSSTRGIVIDVSPMNSITVDGGVARVGAGTRTGELCERLAEQCLAVPTGTCPSVGIAGLTLGGGIGILGRAYGLTLDHLLAAQVVLADGRIVDCDEERHSDLFWALRGAGAGNFGVVTSFTFRPRPAPRVTNFRLVWAYPQRCPTRRECSTMSGSAGCWPSSPGAEIGRGVTRADGVATMKISRGLGGSRVWLRSERDAYRPCAAKLNDDVVPSGSATLRFVAGAVVEAVAHQRVERALVPGIEKVRMRRVLASRGE